MTDRVKVLCGKCGRLICRVVEHDGGELRYRYTVGGGGLTDDPGAVFCPEHGWPELGAEALAQKLSAARESGRVGVFRAATVHRKPPRS